MRSARVLYVHEPHRPEGKPLRPSWRVTTRKGKGSTRLGCWEQNVFRAAPWPKTGGFCFLHNVRADKQTGAILLPKSLTPSTTDMSGAKSIFAAHMPDILNGTRAVDHQRGSVRFTKVEDDNPGLCNAHQTAARTVLITPVRAQSSLKHWAVTVLAAFSLNRHLQSTFALPPLTHLVHAPTDGKAATKWSVAFWRALTRAKALPPGALSSFRGPGMPSPAWAAESCFNAIFVGIGGGHTMDPLWVLDRTDILALRSILALEVGLPRLASLTREAAIQSVKTSDPAALRVLIVNRKTRSIGNPHELGDAIQKSAPTKRVCAPFPADFGANCDMDWHAESVEIVKMEDLSAHGQIRTVLDGPNVLVVPHGAGTVHATYLQPCSVVIEVMPYGYPQWSFTAPTMRSGSYILYLAETTALGNPALTCQKPKSSLLNSTCAVTGLHPRDKASWGPCHFIARAKPVMQVDPAMLLQLVHRAAHLRRSCMINYPEIELLPHEVMMKQALLKMSERHARVTTSSGLPLVYAGQEAWQLHVPVPMIATGHGISKKMARGRNGLDSIRRLDQAALAPLTKLLLLENATRLLVAYTSVTRALRCRGDCIRPAQTQSLSDDRWASWEGKLLLDDTARSRNCSLCLHRTALKGIASRAQFRGSCAPYGKKFRSLWKKDGWEEYNTALQSSG